jgi:hypothetical protein
MRKLRLPLPPPLIDGALLADAARHDRKRFKRMVQALRRAGFSDREIVAGLANVKGIISAVRRMP